MKNTIKIIEPKNEEEASHIEVHKGDSLVVKLDLGMHEFATEENIFLVAGIPYYKSGEARVLLRKKMGMLGSGVKFINNDHLDYRKDNLIDATVGASIITNVVKVIEATDDESEYIEVYKKDKLVVKLDMDKKEFAETYNLFLVAGLPHYNMFVNDGGEIKQLRKNIKYALGFDAKHRIKFKNGCNLDYRKNNTRDNNISDDSTEYSRNYMRDVVKKSVQDFDSCLKKVVKEINSYYKSKLTVEDVEDKNEGVLLTLLTVLFTKVEDHKSRLKVIKRFMKASIMYEFEMGNHFTKISTYKSLKFDHLTIANESKNALVGIGDAK